MFLAFSGHNGRTMKLASLEAIVRVLNDAHARYLVVGGLAVAAHGYGRATFDIDLVIQLQPDNVRRAMGADLYASKHCFV